MKKVLLALAGCTAMFAFNAPSMAAVIDFEPPPCLDCGYMKSNYYEDGFRVYGRFTHYGAGDWYGDVFNNGSSGAIRTVISPDSSVTLVHNAGKVFDLDSVEIAPYGRLHAAPTVTFVGITANGSTVTQVVDTYGDYFRTYHFSDDFNRVQSVSVVQTATYGAFPGELVVPVASYDRFVATAVPLPGAVWLLGSGFLTLLGWRRRTG